MNNQIVKNVRFWLIMIAMVSTNLIQAQAKQQKLLLRDSLDYKGNKLKINTTNNEFSPIPFKGGLLYVSNKPSLGRNNNYNRVYWSASPKFKIIDGVVVNEIEGDSLQYKLNKMEKTDDFTAPTSNDNNMLVNYRRVRNKFNKVEQEFLTFSTDQAFDYNDSIKTIVYAKQRKLLFSRVPHWKLFQANVIDGRLRNKHRIRFDDKDADYLYPFIDSNGKRLYFASNKKGGQGGYDIYYVNKVGDDFELKPRPVNELNSSSDDISYFRDSLDVYFSSNRAGGLGGFDVYGLHHKNNEVNNLGYPLNSSNDEVSVKKYNKDFYLTTNRLQNFDIYGATYEPVFYQINGLLIYKNDSTLVPNHKMYYMDADLGITIDTLISDDYAKYKFTGKPNRNYVFTTLNGDSVLEQFSILTVAGQKTFDYITPIGGRSPKQIADSIAALLAANEKRRLDSIDALGITTKFVVHYGFDKNVITKKEKFVLDYLLSRLKQLPAANIAIGAFTDCIGSDKYNYSLSVRRAKAVYAYLIKNGLDKNRILTNGYAKKYNIAPCIVKSSKNSIKAQTDNRRAEIVLSNSKDQDWESLEKARGAGYYKIFNADSKLPTENVTENIQITPLVSQKSINKPVSVEKQEAKAVTTNEVAIKKQVAVVKKDVIEKKKTIVEKTITEVKPVQSEGLSKEDIIKALDSLSKLKKEQDRIVDYLTQRINNKPIEIFVTSDSVTVEIYDNGTDDKDNVTVIYNKRIVVDKQELKVNQPIKFKLKVDNYIKNNELILVAETLGTSPPNTAVMFITEKSGKRQQVMFNTDLTHNGVVYFIRIGKK